MASRLTRKILWGVTLLAIMPGCSLAPKNFKAIKNPAPLVRARAISMGRHLPDPAVVPSLLRSLDDKDQVVRLAAFAELKKRSGQDFGYIPYAEPNERAPAVAMWKSWWEGQGQDSQPGLPRSRRFR
ncbi:MAG: hypothetical protein JWN86_3445 [Planctomycetota bacterium]|nr:hypothetical protein [Planctomycetota bacterium]